jgi:outer membrane protein assembly factor BamB
MNIKPALAVLSGVLAVAGAARADNWPQWRGPSFNGASTETNLPTVLDKTTMLWETKLTGRGSSSPIVWGDRIFLTVQEAGSNKLLAQCFDRKTGTMLWSKECGIGILSQAGGRNDSVSPSAVTDGKSVIFTFATGDMAAFSFDGQSIWSRNIQKDHGAWNMNWLYGASPLLYKSTLYLPVLHRDVPIGRGGPRPGGAGADSYLLAINPADGKDIWKSVRPNDARAESKESYATPTPYESNGRTELLLVAGNCVTGHSLDGGKELWRCGGWNLGQDQAMRIVPTVTVANDLFIVCTPKGGGETFAIKAGGSGLITDTGVAWRNKSLASDVCCPLFYRGNLYVMDGDFRKGISLLDLKTGQPKWTTRIASSPVLRSSPTGADGKIYFMNENGDAWVLSADDGQILSKTSLGGQGATRASITAAQGQLFARAGDKLYCFEKK